MTIQELMESERTGIQLLRSIGNKHPKDTETQRLVASAALEAADRLVKLNELLYYADKDKKAEGAGGNEQQGDREQPPEWGGPE